MPGGDIFDIKQDLVAVLPVPHLPAGVGVGARVSQLVAVRRPAFSKLFRRKWFRPSAPGYIAVSPTHFVWVNVRRLHD